MSSETVLIFGADRLPDYEVVIEKKITCKLTGQEKVARFDVQLDMRLGSHLFCSTSFKERLDYGFNRGMPHSKVETKEQQIRLADKTIDTLASFGATLPDVVELWKEKDDELSDYSMPGAIAELEQSVVDNKESFFKYVHVTRAVSTLAVACAKGELVPAHSEYIHDGLFGSPVTTLLYDSLMRLFEM